MERRNEPRLQTSENLSFIVPVLGFKAVKYIDGDGKIINKSRGGLCLTTNIPLEPGHVLRAISFSPYIALVKWVAKENSHYKAGLVKK